MYLFQQINGTDGVAIIVLVTLNLVEKIPVGE